MLAQTKILLWRLLAIIALLLGLIGVFLPVVPTVPFILMAAWAASQGWPQLEHYLLTHQRFGPTIRQWRESGAVPYRAKCLATIMMTGSAVMLWLSPLHPGIKAGVSAVLILVLIWLWRRPEAE
jgi:uncharacterized membrane protein YbaN (DUF454 family)